MGAVARNAAPLCRYYSKMCDADNHAVREVGKYFSLCIFVYSPISIIHPLEYSLNIGCVSRCC